MADTDRIDFEAGDRLLDAEDDATLAAIDRGLKAAQEGRVVSSTEARRRIEQWLTGSTTPTNR